MINIIRDQQALFWENIQNKPDTYPAEVSWTDILSKPDTYPANVVSTDITVYLSPTGSDDTGDGSSGSPWATLAHALSVLYPTRALPGVTITIQHAAGDYTLPATLEKIPANYALAGTVYTRAVSGIYSSSGSSGNYSLVVTLDDVTGITTDDYVIFHTISGGTNGKYLGGYWPVTAVDSVNNRVTVTTTHDTAPSGAVSATAEVVKGRLHWSGCHGLNNCHCNIEGLGLHGESSQYGLVLGSAQITLTRVGLSGWSQALRMYITSGIGFCSLSYCGLTATAPIFAASGGDLYANNCACVGDITFYNGTLFLATVIANNIMVSSAGSVQCSGVEAAAITATAGSTISLASTTYSSVSPALNTVGNNNSIIIG